MVTITDPGAVVVVAPAGDMDIESRSAWEPAIDKACSTAGNTIVVDLAAVAFMDSSGLNMLFHAQQLATKHNLTLRITNPPTQVIRLFKVTGLVGHFGLNGD